MDRFSRLKVHPAEPPRYAMLFGPETAMIVAAASGVAGLGVSAAGAISQGKQQKAMAEYNARLAEREAQQARQAADLQEQRHRDKVAKLLSSQRAAIGASGLDLEGSPLLVMQETASEGELDALLIRHSGSMEESRLRSQAAADRMAGRAAQLRGYYGAGASLLTGISKVASLYGPKTQAPTGVSPSAYTGTWYEGGY